MNSKQTTVMWMGLLLIILRFFTNGQFKAIWNTILSKDPTTDGAPVGPHGLPQPVNPLYPLLGPKYISSTGATGSTPNYFKV